MGGSLWRGGRADSCDFHPSAKTAHLRSLRAVAAVVDGCRDAHHHGREEVPGDVVVLSAREFALKHLDQHEVQLNTLQTHPGERGQEAEVENPGDDGTHNLTWRQTLHKGPSRNKVVHAFT